MTSEIKQKFASYPAHVLPYMLSLRELIYSVAKQNILGDVTETLKWGELSYLTKNGSPVRMDWKAKSPQHYFLFFHCQTTLVDTFRVMYADTLEFQGNRALILNLSVERPEHVLRQCLKMAFTYKKIKHLPLLGA